MIIFSRSICTSTKRKIVKERRSVTPDTALRLALYFSTDAQSWLTYLIPDPMIEDTTMLVSICAAFVAALSALYARWQAFATQRANDIALHENRLAVYKGLVRFRAHVSARGTSIKEDEAWRYAEVADLSEFYYPADIHAQLDSIFERALKILSLHDRWEESKEYGEHTKTSALNKQRHALMREVRDDCFKIADEIKRYLRVGGA